MTGDRSGDHNRRKKCRQCGGFDRRALKLNPSVRLAVQGSKANESTVIRSNSPSWRERIDRENALICNQPINIDCPQRIFKNLALSHCKGRRSTGESRKNWKEAIYEFHGTNESNFNEQRGAYTGLNVVPLVHFQGIAVETELTAIGDAKPTAPVVALIVAVPGMGLVVELEIFAHPQALARIRLETVPVAVYSTVALGVWPAITRDPSIVLKLPVRASSN